MSKKLVSFQPASLNRRHFLATASAAAASLTILRPGLLRGAEPMKKLNLGLLGCGGRGTFMMNLFEKHGGYNIAAAFDYFQDRVDTIGNKFKIDPAMRFTGLNGYKKMLEQKNLDVVIIQSPPYFHPEQAADAVAAGKHIYMAKPVAVDVPGCKSIEQSGKDATAKKQVFLVDFQTRAHPSFQQAVKLVHEGKIGKIISGEATYQTSLMFVSKGKEWEADPKNPEVRLRNWALDKALSGDVITEQNIHALDVASWILNAEPIKAYGTGGRRRPFGECWDYFACIFYYPEGVVLSFSSKQVGKGWDDIQCRVYGEQGTIDTHYGGDVQVKCDDAYNGGKIQNMYSEGPTRNIATFYDNVITGDCSNTTVAPSARSNLLTILGRTAAYENDVVYWDKMLKANKKVEFKTKGLKS
jgi:predicted dehydrogenase